MKIGTKTRAHRQACKGYKQRFILEHGYPFCEQCNRSDQYIYSVHHICSAGQYPGHKKLHNDINLILLCVKCHDGFHRHTEEWFDKHKILVRERGLKKLFKRR